MNEKLTAVAYRYSVILLFNKKAPLCCDAIGAFTSRFNCIDTAQSIHRMKV